MMEEAFAAEPAWGREAKPAFAWDPPRSLIAALRSYQRHAARRGPIAAIGRRIAVLRHRFWSVVTGADIPLNARIAGGLMMPHPNGIVVHPAAIIGPNCLLMQQVTLGLGRDGVPTLGAGVTIGAGAKVLGGIHLGDECFVGALSVVARNVPARALVVGIPARVLRQAKPGESLFPD
jgi:serine O-acetyltransferase